MGNKSSRALSMNALAFQGFPLPFTVMERYVRSSDQKIETLRECIDELRPFLRTGSSSISSSVQEKWNQVQKILLELQMVHVGLLKTKALALIDETAHRLQKKVEAEFSGFEFYVTPPVYQALSLALLHAIRNSIDHGIEAPADRMAAGKADSGRLRLELSFKNGDVIFVIEDDGRGISKDLIRQVATTKGLASQDQLARASDQELLSYLFRPGFTTRQDVTDWSGRGVGLDAVFAAVQKLGGHVAFDPSVQVGSRLHWTAQVSQIALPCRVDSRGQKLCSSEVRRDSEFYLFKKIDLTALKNSPPWMKQFLQAAGDSVFMTSDLHESEPGFSYSILIEEQHLERYQRLKD